MTRRTKKTKAADNQNPADAAKVEPAESQKQEVKEADHEQQNKSESQI